MASVDGRIEIGFTEEAQEIISRSAARVSDLERRLAETEVALADVASEFRRRLTDLENERQS